jgi:hypothetical protein
VGRALTCERATAKIDAFAFTRYGTIDAEVVRVSTDASDGNLPSALSHSPIPDIPMPAPSRDDGRHLLFSNRQGALGGRTGDNLFMGSRMFVNREKY